MNDRRYWLDTLLRICRPVLDAAARRRLKAELPVESVPGYEEERRRCTYLEALGRTLAGLAPWLETDSQEPSEEPLRQEMANLARSAIAAGVDPQSPDYMNFTHYRQPLVDAAFLAHALLRAPTQLIDRLDPRTRRQLADALAATRCINPPPNNWLLFAATVEAALARMGETWDVMRVDYAIRQHEQWYKGDGVYGDGAPFHFDYYNSYVIQPMLIDVLDEMQRHCDIWQEDAPRMRNRARRYAAILERLISPEGTIPVVGRSICYRFGALQSLAQSALRRDLPEGVTPAQVRCAMTAVIRRMIEAPGTFDERGFLRIGFAGPQISLAEPYISTGSVYLCTTGMLPLGLPATDEFWTAPPTKWTSQRVYAGEQVPADHAIRD
jgi:hypothetical protein